jgi:hypothetical protein
MHIHQHFNRIIYHFLHKKGTGKILKYLLIMILLIKYSKNFLCF